MKRSSRRGIVHNPLYVRTLLFMLLFVCMPLLSLSAQQERAAFFGSFVHEDFSFRPEDFIKSISDLPLATQIQIYHNTQPFLDLMGETFSLPAYFLQKIDKSNPVEAIPKEIALISLDKHNAMTDRPGLFINEKALPDFNALILAARFSGHQLSISSAYRSIKYQDELFLLNIEKYGELEAKRRVAPPGFSEHHIGTAVDFGAAAFPFSYTKDSAWLRENAWKYGFVLSYPEGYEKETGYRYESWHYRYIGRAAAELTHRYFFDLPHLFLDFYDKKAELFRRAYTFQKTIKIVYNIANEN